MEKSALIYSEAVLHFLAKTRSMAREILVKEMGLKVGRTRFSHKHHSYPLVLVAFEHPKRLGYFDPELYEIGLNKELMIEQDSSVFNILRHELAHYITFIEHGPNTPHHGEAFRNICRRYGWDKEVYLSQGKLEAKAHPKKAKISEKVQKLIALSNNSSEEEASSAMVKAKELILKYNVQSPPKFSHSDEEWRLIRLAKFKRVSAKWQAIASILRHFYVYPVFNHGKGIAYLEAFGEKHHIEIVESLSVFLDREFEKFWKEETSLKGPRQKNAFFRGIAVGYCEKIKECTHHSSTHALIVQRLEQAIPLAYPSLSVATSRLSLDRKAESKGRGWGRKLDIKKTLKSCREKGLALLSFACHKP